MSSLTVAVFGYGSVGRPVVSALVARDVKVILLSRDVSKLQGIPTVVKAASVDYANETEVSKLLKENAVDVVVVALGGGPDAVSMYTVTQVGIARAAKEAGVKLLLPNEWGINAEGHPGDSMLGLKGVALAKIQEIGIPTTRVITGVFVEFIQWLTSTSSKPGEFVVAGKGDKKLSFVALEDVGGYVAHVLATIPLSELYNKTLLIEGQAATFQEVAHILGKKITHLSPEELDPIVRTSQELADKGGVRTGYLASEPDAPEDVVSQRSTSGNAHWKGHHWKQINEVSLA